MKEPALAMIELKSVAKGVVVTDAIVKKAPVKILQTSPVCPGKYMILFAGEVADVEESYHKALEIGGDMIVNDMFIPYLHIDVVPAISGTTKIEEFGAVGIVESFSISSCVKAADLAAKTTPIKLVEIRLANGLGGKGYFVMTGRLFDVEESLRVAREYVSEQGMLANSEIISSPHPELIEKGLYW